MTAQELAEACGYSHQFIRDLECLNLIRRPRVYTLSTISKALDIDIRQLFDDIE